ncbi:hypothetical protein HWQ67_17615 [Candidatus Magnetobacterium casensis]|uniref:Secreted protein n=1 Tax=Candidatus Magnetobacterium casense TaxID=1455061 RepID=A0ABS6S3G3_9BACT|nr:hypothetical protein [Candidatus Magnetobacterium casensis]
MAIHFATHIHTHTRGEKNVAEVDKSDDATDETERSSVHSDSGGEEDEGEDYEDGESETDEGPTESECDGSSDEDDGEESGE